MTTKIKPTKRESDEYDMVLTPAKKPRYSRQTPVQLRSLTAPETLDLERKIGLWKMDLSERILQKEIDGNKVNGVVWTMERMLNASNAIDQTEEADICWRVLWDTRDAATPASALGQQLTPWTENLTEEVLPEETVRMYATPNFQINRSRHWQKRELQKVGWDPSRLSLSLCHELLEIPRDIKMWDNSSAAREQDEKTTGALGAAAVAPAAAIEREAAGKARDASAAPAAPAVAVKNSVVPASSNASSRSKSVTDSEAEKKSIPSSSKRSASKHLSPLGSPSKHKSSRKSSARQGPRIKTVPEHPTPAPTLTRLRKPTEEVPKPAEHSRSAPLETGTTPPDGSSDAQGACEPPAVASAPAAAPGQLTKEAADKVRAAWITAALSGNPVPPWPSQAGTTSSMDSAAALAVVSADCATWRAASMAVSAVTGVHVLSAPPHSSSDDSPAQQRHSLGSSSQVAQNGGIIGMGSQGLEAEICYDDFTPWHHLPGCGLSGEGYILQPKEMLARFQASNVIEPDNVKEQPPTVRSPKQMAHVLRVAQSAVDAAQDAGSDGEDGFETADSHSDGSSDDNDAEEREQLEEARERLRAFVKLQESKDPSQFVDLDCPLAGTIRLHKAVIKQAGDISASNAEEAQENGQIDEDTQYFADLIVAQYPLDAPTQYLVKWKDWELDGREWQQWEDAKDLSAFKVWEELYPPPQGAGNPPMQKARTKKRKTSR